MTAPLLPDPDTTLDPRCTAVHRIVTSLVVEHGFQVIAVALPDDVGILDTATRTIYVDNTSPLIDQAYFFQQCWLHRAIDPSVADGLAPVPARHLTVVR